MLEFALIRYISLFAIGLLCFDAFARLLAGETTKLTSREYSLHQRVDAMVEREAIGPLALLCSDADFLRRITLDLTGAIPTVEQVQTFLDNSSPNKLNRDAEPNAVTRDVGRIAFGMDMQCAQCHDHPLVKDYLQEDYYGLYAYWHRIRLFTEPKSKAIVLSELADGEASFKSVFTGNGNESALPKPPKGAALIDEPMVVGDAAYVVVPAKDKAGKPKFSRRQSLSKSLSSNPQFRRNLANRLWLVMFGRGIVHPIDLHHTDNPPTNPALLQLLADEVAIQGFQLRPIIRQLAMTRAYQRSCDVPIPTTVNFRDIAARKVQLSLETNDNGTEVIDREVDHGHLFHTVLQAVGVDSTGEFEVGGRNYPIADPAKSSIEELIA